MTELREELARCILNACDRHGIDRATAASVNDAAWSMLCDSLGTTRVYVPAASRDERDCDILDAWRKGPTVEALAKQHGVHKATVLRVIKRQRAKCSQSFAPRRWEL